MLGQKSINKLGRCPFLFKDFSSFARYTDHIFDTFHIIMWQVKVTRKGRKIDTQQKNRYTGLSFHSYSLNQSPWKAMNTKDIEIKVPLGIVLFS